MFWVGKKHFVSVEDYQDRHYEVNRSDLISPELKEMLSSIPKNETSRLTILGDKNYNNGEYIEAVENYSKALMADGNNLEGLFYRGLCYIQLDKFHDSINDLTKLIKLKPEFTQAYHYRAIARIALHSYNQLKLAISDSTEAIERGQKDGTLFFMRGYCNLMLAQDDFAFQDWIKAKIAGVAKENEESWKKDYIE